MFSDVLFAADFNDIVSNRRKRESFCGGVSVGGFYLILSRDMIIKTGQELVKSF